MVDSESPLFSLSAGIVPVVVSSDVGGSIRIPSLFCGLFGHKPTGGTVSNARTYPSTGQRGVDRFCQLGPCTRHAVDLMPMLRVLAKEEARGSTAYTNTTSINKTNSKKGSKNGTSDNSSNNNSGGGRGGGGGGNFSSFDGGALRDPDTTLSNVTVFVLDRPLGSSALRSRLDPDQDHALQRALDALGVSGVMADSLLPFEKYICYETVNFSFKWAAIY